MKTGNSSKKNKNIYIFIGIIFVFGLITGLLFYFKQDALVRDAIPSSLDGLFTQNIFASKTCFYHFLILILITATVFCFIGLPLLIIYIFFEGISIGFIIPIFFSLYKFNALWCFSLYFIFVKLVYIILLFLLFKKFLSFIKYYVKCLRNKSYDFLTSLKFIFLFIFIILLNDCFVYFVSNKILVLLLGKF